ncbi:hypothetical protein EVAR_52237_1 [Eumeta japonica]|uniref:Uncharacterized protein n=1 Tax=Eumeta variegata TaxID=151549 RepID=A0A4C1Z4C3_EUMVA|nr:hypothetical protein EVAR_52237_1 [Eumeta japonica]
MAFDRVWHDGLIHKFLDTALPFGKTAVLLTSSQRNMPTRLRLRGQAVEWKTCVHIDRSLLMIAHLDKNSHIQVLYTLPPDLRCTALVRLMLGSAAPASLNSAEHSASQTIVAIARSERAMPLMRRCPGPSHRLMPHLHPRDEEDSETTADSI